MLMLPLADITVTVKTGESAEDVFPSNVFVTVHL